jgi:TatD DNase family protein
VTGDPPGVGGGRLPPPALIDAHAHLSDERLTRDLAPVLARAAAAGVTRILACGEDVASSEHSVELARREPSVRAAVGIHPHRAASCDDAALRRLRELARDPVVVAIGEIGMDLAGRSAPPADQERALALQLGLARECGKPVCLHVRECGPQVRSIVDRVSGARGYVHCYSEGRDDVESWISRGFFVSFSGTVTYPRADGLRAAAAAVPDDRLLIETDAPALAPQTHRGRRNEPAFIADTYAAVAALRGTTVDALAAHVRRNATTLFGGAW